MEAAPGVGIGPPRAWVGLGGGRRRREAVPSPAESSEGARLLHCAASRRGHREPSILPKTRIPAQGARTESIFRSAEALPHVPLLTARSGWTAKITGGAFRTPHPIQMAAPSPHPHPSDGSTWHPSCHKNKGKVSPELRRRARAHLPQAGPRVPRPHKPVEGWRQRTGRARGPRAAPQACAGSRMGAAGAAGRGGGGGCSNTARTTPGRSPAPLRTETGRAPGGTPPP